MQALIHYSEVVGVGIGFLGVLVLGFWSFNRITHWILDAWLRWRVPDGRAQDDYTLSYLESHRDRE